MNTENAPTPISTAEFRRRFEIAGARTTGRVLGHRTFCMIEEYNVKGFSCAGKRISNDTCLPSETRDIMRRYVKECELMSTLRHPNIVKFYGVCFQPESILPVLIMERLTTDLHRMLEDTPPIFFPLSVKVSLLTDVARGLAYLHGHRPPIIHGDLSARNILLDSRLVAKIDRGSSHIITRAASRFYMPPEWVMEDDSSCYGPSLDVFSFGHLGIITATQVVWMSPLSNLPRDLPPRIYRDLSGHMIARSEVERREKYFTELCQKVGDDHGLVKVIMECLDNDPLQRPSAEQLVSRLVLEMIPDVHNPQKRTAESQLMTQMRQTESCLYSLPQKLPEKESELQVPTASPTTVSSKKENQMLLEDALTKHGYVWMQIIKILVMGIAGAGKTSVKNQLITGLPPQPSGRNSTMLLETPIRAISQTIAKMKKVSNSDAATEWSIVSADQLFLMIASALSARGIIIESDEATDYSSANKNSPSANKTTSDPFTDDIIAMNTTLPLTDNPSPSIATDQPPVSQNSSMQSIPQVVSHSKHCLLEHLEQCQASDELMKVQWVHFIDTGGQPQFRELLPSVVHNMTMIMHVLRLSEDFDEHPKIELFEDGKPCCNLLESAYTNKQILQQTVQSIQVRSSLIPWKGTTVDGESEAKGKRPKIIVVGTHRDLESECSEDRTQKNALTLKLLAPFINDVVLFNGLEEAIFGMNAVDPSDDDRKVISKIRTEVAKLFKVCSKHKVPVGWFLLEQDIRKFAKDHVRGVVSLEECVAVAQSLSIDYEALRAALSYFHQLNVFLYYPSLLPNVVFCDPQVPLNIISSLVAFSYKLRSGGCMEDVLDGRWFRFRDEGIVTVEMLEHEKFSMCFIPGLFSPIELIQLLQYLFIAAPLSSSNCKAFSSNTISKSDEFFLPCLLPTLSPAEINHRSQLFASSSPHLLLVFPSGCIPNGIFSNVVVRLRSIYNWKISPVCVFSNYIEFHLPGFPMTVTLADSFNYIKIQVKFLVSLNNVSRARYAHVFSQIRLAIIECIESTATSLNFVECSPVATFLCGEIGHRCSSTPHAAEILSGEFWKCSEDPHNIICEPLSKDQLLWLRDSTTDSISQIHDELDVPVDLSVPELMEDLAGISDWFLLGSSLGLKTSQLNMIERDVPAGVGSTNQRKSQVLDTWMKGKTGDPSWRDVVAALIKMGQNSVAEKMRMKYSGSVAGSPSLTLLPGVLHSVETTNILSSQHLLDVTDYLQDMEKTELYNLGLVFGLQRQRVAKLRDSCNCQDLCDNIVDCWLQKMDNVEANNMVPSWRNLVLALKHHRVKQTKLADFVAKERQVLI